MRHAIFSIAAWAGALQVVSTPVSTTDGAARLIGVASVLGTLTVLVYKLGVWRQEMEHTRQSAVDEVKRSFDQIDRRLEAIDHALADILAHRARWARWQSRTDRRVERLERSEQSEHPERAS